jgi:hypothetical protein
MSLLRPIWQDLRSKRLWPLAAALLLGIVAVPVLLSSSGGAAVTPPPAAPAPVANGLPAVNDTAAPATAAPTGSARSPFAPVGGASTGSTTTSTTTLPGTTTTPTSPSNPATSTPGGTGSTTPPTTTTPGGTSPGQPTIPTPRPKRAIPALTPDESYSVSLAITKSTGGLDTIHPLERLTALPSAQQPLLVELGVLRGGSRVLFAVQPGTVVSGKGTCIPGPIDCEILSLAQAQTERLSVRTSTGVVRVAMFAVTGITAVKHPSRSAAMKIRKQESGAGRRVLNHSSLKALKLFRYEPGAGAVIDLRNLTLRNS